MGIFSEMSSGKQRQHWLAGPLFSEESKFLKTYSSWSASLRKWPLGSIDKLRCATGCLFPYTSCTIPIFSKNSNQDWGGKKQVFFFMFCVRGFPGKNHILRILSEDDGETRNWILSWGWITSFRKLPPYWDCREEKRAGFKCRSPNLHGHFWKYKKQTVIYRQTRKRKLTKLQ